MIFGNKETPGTRLDAFLTCSDAIWKHRGATRHHIPIDRARHTRTSCSCGLQKIPSLILYGGAQVLNFCTGSLPLPRQFTHYVRSSTCGERDLLSYIVDDPDLSRFDQVVGILLNDLNCSVTRSMVFRIWEARKCVTGGSGAQARRYCCGAESAWRHACSGCSRGCAMACPAPVSSTVSRRSGARAGAEASQHPPGDGRCCQRVRFGLYYRNLLASLLLPFHVPRQH